MYVVCNSKFTFTTKWLLLKSASSKLIFQKEKKIVINVQISNPYTPNIHFNIKLHVLHISWVGKCPGEKKNIFLELIKILLSRSFCSQKVNNFAVSITTTKDTQKHRNYHFIADTS